MQNDTLTAIPGLLVGHAEYADGLTGCTVILCPEGTLGGVDQRGGAPGTRETDALSPLNLVDRVHAVLLAGGSAFGLDAAGGVMRYLEEQGVGYPAGPARVPIVPAAILFDLGIGRADVRPDAALGYQACLHAGSGPVAEGSVGAGMGATVGKLLGMERAVKGGIGSACLDLGGGLLVGALAAVNAVGDVIDPQTGLTVAGPRAGGGTGFLDSRAILREKVAQAGTRANIGENTVIGVVATNATLTKSSAQKVAQMAHDGLARTVRPAHTMLDGDTIFALATCQHPAGGSPMDVSAIGAFAAEAFAQAVLRAVRKATSVGETPSICDL